MLIKNVTIEEKAKRYDEILARAEGAKLPYYKENIMSKVKELVDYLIPELKESEDEKIRKAIIDFLKETLENVGESPNIWTMNNAKKWIAWLEKQGEVISDKIVEKSRTEKQRVLLTETDGISCIDWDCRSLDDVKTLLKCGLDFICNIESNKQIIPDNRFGGCTFRVPTRYDKIEKQGEQKVYEWSEEDEKMLVKCDAAMGYYSPKDKQNVKDWLNSLKERIQPKQEWSKEDEQMLNSLISSLARISASTRTDSTSINYTFSKEIDWLKSLKERYTWKPSDEQRRAICLAAGYIYNLHPEITKILKDMLNELEFV